jgi:hypothetical protein
VVDLLPENLTRARSALALPGHAYPAGSASTQAFQPELR